MCVLSIKVPIRKNSGNLFNDLRICYHLPGVLNSSEELLHFSECGDLKLHYS